jgi:anaerobic magnesium-protoporphyrin IX monomethyl ester cyclase
MNITLISLDHELYCAGIRILSSCLKKAGHHVKCLFLPPGSNQAKIRYESHASQKLYEQIHDICNGTELIGISLMTNQYLPAIAITEKLRRMGAPKILWGGIQPTIEPEECLNYADIVCLGEGEAAITELADLMSAGMDYCGVKNLWVNDSGKIVRNEIRPLVQKIDEIPFPDYSCDGHFIRTDDRIEPLTVERLIHHEGERYQGDLHGIRYPIMTSRGCPYSCTYCCNNVYKKLYKGQRRLRWRTANNVVAELKMLQQHIGAISFVYFVDDNFTARPVKELADFCTTYKREINLPFFCQCSPLTITEEKLDILLSSGCKKISMGIETASSRVARMYNRQHFHKALPKAISLLESNRSKMPMPPSYQFIVDNPYEDIEDTLDTLKMAVNLKRPWDNPIYSLMLFPGTDIYEKAYKDGLVENKTEQIYARDWNEWANPILKYWIRLYRANRLPSLLRVMIHSNIYKYLAGLCERRKKVMEAE